MKRLTWLAPVAGALMALHADAQDLPDLAMLAVSGPETAGTAQAIALTNTVANLGTTNSGPWQYQLYVSGDPAITTGDTVLATSVFFPSGLDPGESRSYTNAVTIPAGLATGVYYFGAIADFVSAITETNESNNVAASAPVGIGYGPDLAVMEVKGPAFAGTAQPIALTNTIANLGVGDSGSWQYRLYLSPDAAITTGDTVLATSAFFVTGLAPGQTRMYTNNVTMPAGLATGTYYFGAIADFSGSIGETNEANNAAASAPVGMDYGPDLAVMEVKGPAFAGTAQPIALTNTIANLGVGDSGSWQYRLYLSPDAAITTGDTVLATSAFFVTGLAPGQTRMYTNNVTMPAGLATGTYYFGAIADFSGSIGETNEANNAGVSAPVALGFGPDLVVESLSGPALVAPSQTVSVVSAIGNPGVGHSGSWQYRLYLSSDTSIATGDTLLVTSIYFSDGIVPGGTSIHTNAVAIPSGLAAGTYYFGAMVDPNNDVVESSEGNNTGISTPVFLSIGPRIGAISVNSNVVTLSLTGLVATFAYTVQRTPELLRADLWSNAGVFTALSAGTNWMEGISSTTGFSYRVLEAMP